MCPCNRMRKDNCTLGMLQPANDLRAGGRKVLFVHAVRNVLCYAWYLQHAGATLKERHQTSRVTLRV